MPLFIITLCELLTLAFCIHHFQHAWLKGLAAIIFANYLMALSIIDWRTQRLPDSLTLSLLWLGLLINSFQLFTPLFDSIWGAAAGYGVLFGIYQLHRWLTGKDGMGYGDFKLLAALGAWLGWRALPDILLVSALLTLLLYALFKNQRRWQWQSKVPYGPGLALAGFMMLIVLN